MTKLLSSSVGTSLKLFLDEVLQYFIARERAEDVKGGVKDKLHDKTMEAIEGLFEYLEDYAIRPSEMKVNLNQLLTEHLHIIADSSRRMNLSTKARLHSHNRKERADKGANKMN